MALSILVADSLHINQRNFGSFFTFVEQQKATVHFEDSHKDWIALYGVYDSKLPLLSEKIEVLSHLNQAELFEFKIHEINLFETSRAELLAYVSVKDTWYNEAYPTTLAGVFEKLYKRNRTELLQNMAAAWYWVDFWKKRLAEFKQFSHCCVFSGSLIYQKSLISLLKYTPTKVIVMESLFTGNEYYCEERYSGIANNCDIKHKAVYQSYQKKLEKGDLYDKERTKAINKFLMMKNKNVQQPAYSELIEFDENNPTVAIIGQVVNDFSVLEYRNLGISTIQVYKELLVKLTSAGFNVVLKTHPWEEKKTNIRTSLTKDVLMKFVSTLTPELQNRIVIVDHYSIKQLFNQATYILGLNSQGLLEAAFEGLKPIQLGNAFYGKKGFTHDYGITQIDQLVCDLIDNKLNGILSLKELDLFEEFITILLQKHTVSIHNSGLLNLRHIFEPVNIIPLVEPPAVKTKPNATGEIHLRQVEKIKPIVSANIGPVQVQTGLSNLPAPMTSSCTLIKISENVSLVLNGNVSNRKMRKLVNNPRLFFADSKHLSVRLLQYLFKHKW
ncbi:capsule biosynthesis protein [Kingella negevensis]|uniref:Capsule polysaccharide biosynthesis protein n=1 Tax=Kingella negevensis TaxID=1522312 RepID=A0A238T9A7_9NEIS|nr:capsule biosynthesis protein [Kingella negevensis]MDK4679268.1 capsule biosynthesis protein [Kingella negevensis]MDK4683010.1 capsule biosynthesis protein [Kingella negevensis]MDK4683797.1 capsule biosynthesis protein [Kingella negevensis]MDK4688442.1 capsule biosynthesis protein [Kingella negevensis]MDK4691210.1 capsule biosynthesis protein [Kingella negevensis]